MAGNRNGTKALWGLSGSTASSYLNFDEWLSGLHLSAQGQVPETDTCHMENMNQSICCRFECSDFSLQSPKGLCSVCFTCSPFATLTVSFGSGTPA